MTRDAILDSRCATDNHAVASRSADCSVAHSPNRVSYTNSSSVRRQPVSAWTSSAHNINHHEPPVKTRSSAEMEPNGALRSTVNADYKLPVNCRTSRNSAQLDNHSHSQKVSQTSALDSVLSSVRTDHQALRSAEYRANGDANRHSRSYESRSSGYRASKTCESRANVLPDRTSNW
jgi:hypothetical protein